MATENDIDSLAESRLTKNDASPPSIKNDENTADDVSALTGSINSRSTTKSKAKRHVNKTVKVITQHYNCTISDLNVELEDKDKGSTLLKSQLSNSKAAKAEKFPIKQ